jgi:hypothetical protein
MTFTVSEYKFLSRSAGFPFIVHFSQELDLIPLDGTLSIARINGIDELL